MINDKTLKNNYCLESNEYLNNCLEADYYIFNHTEKYNCTKCMKNYKFVIFNAIDSLQGKHLICLY